jgi:Protein of unknown function (DUF4232)
MGEIVRGRRDGLRTLCALFALSTLFAHDARAQSGRAFTQDDASAPAQCGDGQISVSDWWVYVSMGPMRYIEVVFTNTSASPCTLNGFPSFEFLNKAGRPIRAANRVDAPVGFSASPKPVTIEPGETARFFAHYFGRYDETRGKPCPTYRRFRVTAPGTKRMLVRRLRGDAVEVCSDLEVTPVLGPSEY